MFEAYLAGIVTGIGVSGLVYMLILWRLDA